MRAASTMRQSVNPADRSAVRTPSAPRGSRRRPAASIGRAPGACRPRLRSAPDSSPYTESSTQTVSASTRWDTHAPCATNASAFSTCAGSSLTISRTRTLVSIARMRAPRPGPNACIHVGDAPAVRRHIEHGLVNVPRRVLRRPPDDDFVPEFAPLDLRTGRQPKAASDARRHRYLTLGGDLRLDSLHCSTLFPNSCLLIVAFITLVRQSVIRTCGPPP